jgi:hypothetical protein
MEEVLADAEYGSITVNKATGLLNHLESDKFMLCLGLFFYKITFIPHTMKARGAA